jgi:hypothetical protein
MSDASKQQDWTNPAAMAIPKGGFPKGKVEITYECPLWVKSRREDDLREEAVDFAEENEDTLRRNEFRDAFGDYLLDEGRVGDCQELENAVHWMAATITAARAISGA